MIKPKILMSRCFFEPVRYDGKKIEDPLVEKIIPFVDILYFCPEVEFGLGVPRPIIVIELIGKEERLIQQETGMDLTIPMREFLNKYLQNIKDLDGALLKSKSPSCGVGSAKLFSSNKVIGKTHGFLTKTLLELYPYLPVIDNQQLSDKIHYYNYLFKIFLLRNFKEIKENPQKLEEFHLNHRKLLKLFNQRLEEKMNKFIMQKDLPLEEKIKIYDNLFQKLLANNFSKRKLCQLFLELYEFFYYKLTFSERKKLLKEIEKYQKGRGSLKELIFSFKNCIKGFGERELLKESIFYLLPDQLL